MSHGAGDEQVPDALGAEWAGAVAETMQALATPSRVRILAELHRTPCSVGDLAERVGMEPSAVSHQLRLLRHLGLVAGHRDGRRVVYGLYDEHVSELLQQAFTHVAHVRTELARGVPSGTGGGRLSSRARRSR